MSFESSQYICIEGQQVPERMLGVVILVKVQIQRTGFYTVLTITLTEKDVEKPEPISTAIGNGKCLGCFRELFDISSKG